MEWREGREKVKEQRGVPVPVHSQVQKIKQEYEKIVPEIGVRPVFRELNRQLSRSPLGISGRPISVVDM